MSEKIRTEEVEVSENKGLEEGENKSVLSKINVEPLKAAAEKVWEFTKKNGPVYLAKTAEMTSKSLVSVSKAADKAGGKIPSLNPTALSLIAVLIVYAVFSFSCDTYYVITHQDYLLSYLWHQSPLLIAALAGAINSWKKKSRKE